MFDPITIWNISTVACGTARDRVAHRKGASAAHRADDGDARKAVEVGNDTSLASREIGHKLLSLPHTKAGQLQRACLDLLREHKRKGDVPTNGRFLFYELEQRGVVPKKYEGINPATGKKWARTPLQDVSVASMHLREHGLVPWHWIEDKTRTVDGWHCADSVPDYLMDAIDRARINPWGDELPPLIICESRATKGVLRSLAYEYLVKITATGGQCGGFIVTDIVPLLTGNNRRVLYIGDNELRGPGDQIEQNTKRYIEKHAGRTFGDRWTKIALTEAQVMASLRLQRLAITKLDKRYKPAKEYEAIECEALGQGVLVRIIRKHLDGLLPEPLADVREREQAQRAKVRAALKKIRARP